MINALTVDVEDFFQVSAFEKYIPREKWESIPRRVEANTERILALFQNHKVKATFFILGWVAQRHPNLIQKILNEGHELACHGYSHIRASTQTPKEFYDDVKKAKTIIEDIVGRSLKGYRAPSYSISQNNLWALDILDDMGFEYSSSIYPVKHDLYGMPNAPRFVFKPNKTRQLLEIPVSTVQIAGKNYPCGGGGFFRLFPYNISRWAINRVNNSDKEACIFYFHPWELDAEQPRVNGIDLRTRIRHYLNLNRTELRLNKLLADFQWDTMENVFLS